MLTIIKAIAVTIVTTLALIGVLYDFRDQAGNVTNWGVAAVTLILFSGLVAIITEIWEQSLARRQEERADRLHQDQKEDLLNISAGIKSLDSPFFPASALITLRVPIHSSPIDGSNLPNLLEDGELLNFIQHAGSRDEPSCRLQIPGAFLYIEDKSVTQVGVYSLDNPWFNLVTEPTHKVFVRLGSEEVSKLISENELNKDALCQPTSVNFTFRTTRLKNKIEISADIFKLEVARFIVFDDCFYVTFFMPNLKSNKHVDETFGLADLENSTMRANFEYLKIAGLSAQEPEGLKQIKIHDLSIFTGTEERRILSLSPDILNDQKWIDSDLPVGGQAKALRLTLNFKITSSLFKDSISILS